jgi:hypothetical protein
MTTLHQSNGRVVEVPIEVDPAKVLHTHAVAWDIGKTRISFDGAPDLIIDGALSDVTRMLAEPQAEPQTEPAEPAQEDATDGALSDVTAKLTGKDESNDTIAPTDMAGPENASPGPGQGANAGSGPG